MPKEEDKNINIDLAIINQNKKKYIRDNIEYFTEIFKDFKVFFDETIENYPIENHLAIYCAMDVYDAMHFQNIFEKILQISGIDHIKLYNNDHQYIMNLLYEDIEKVFKCFNDFDNFFNATINCLDKQHQVAKIYKCDELDAIKYKKLFDYILDNNTFEIDDLKGS